MKMDYKTPCKHHYNLCGYGSHCKLTDEGCKVLEGSCSEYEPRISEALLTSSRNNFCSFREDGNCQKLKQAGWNDECKYTLGKLLDCPLCRRSYGLMEGTSVGDLIAASKGQRERVTLTSLMRISPPSTRAHRLCQ